MSPTVRRATAALASMLVIGAAILFGFAFWTTGASQRYAVVHQYTIQFGQAGASCTPRAPAAIEIGSGRPLGCGIGVGSANFPGFSRDDNLGILRMALNLGGDGLSPADQTQLQTEVDRIAATVSESEKAHYTGLWGFRMQLVGAAFIPLGAVLTVLIWRLLTRRLPPRSPYVFPAAHVRP